MACKIYSPWKPYQWKIFNDPWKFTHYLNYLFLVFLWLHEIWFPFNFIGQLISTATCENPIYLIVYLLKQLNKVHSSQSPETLSLW